MPNPFKTCPGCRTEWTAREDLLSDPEVTLIGFQVDMIRPRGGLFLFNHRCRDTFAIAAEEFLDLVDQPLVTGSLRGTPVCERHCLHRSDIGPCRQHCECTFVRDVPQVVRHWPKREATARAE